MMTSSTIGTQVTKERSSPKQTTQISLDYPGESALEEGLLNDDALLTNGHAAKESLGDADVKMEGSATECTD
ncbi:hypothetical protein EW146_g7874 [Bondarzewia mesenterica]|uniref:Uncharacterized protein n=1 Tax=Bondarzewia mesenterica TaxID=1095465 RepID=A0A4S4LJ23_9AGAM|nr:hypothetical protein EW146_g7874 [Bondarzewia mesenterica]